MNFIVLNTTKLQKPPIAVHCLGERLLVSTKSNKLIQMNLNLQEKTIITVPNTIYKSILNRDSINCILKSKSIFKYKNGKSHIDKLKIDISFISSIETNKFLVGCKNGKILITDEHFKPIRSFYGCTSKIIDIVDIKDKIIGIDKKINIIDKKTLKVKTFDIGFVTCIKLYKHLLLCGTDINVYLFDINHNKILKCYNLKSAISVFQTVNDRILIGTEDGNLHIATIRNNDLNILNKIQLEGVINSIECFFNKIYVGIGREETNSSFSRNSKFKNKLYCCTLN